MDQELIAQQLNSEHDALRQKWSDVRKMIEP